MKPSPLLLAAVMPLVGCMCRPGTIDCTTGRAYPAFCKPLCGGPFDPFIWVTGDCNCDCCCGPICGAYTPYGGRTHHGESVFVPGCVGPPLQWASPAVPTTRVPVLPVGYCPPGPTLAPAFGPGTAESPPGPAMKPPAPPAPASKD